MRELDVTYVNSRDVAAFGGDISTCSNPQDDLLPLIIGAAVVASVLVLGIAYYFYALTPMKRSSSKGSALKA